MRTGTTKRDRKTPKPACRKEKVKGYKGEKQLSKLINRLIKLEDKVGQAVNEAQDLDMRLWVEAGEPPRRSRGGF